MTDKEQKLRDLFRILSEIPEIYYGIYYNNNTSQNVNSFFIKYFDCTVAGFKNDDNSNVYIWFTFDGDIPCAYINSYKNHIQCNHVMHDRNRSMDIYGIIVLREETTCDISKYFDLTDEIEIEFQKLILSLI